MSSSFSTSGASAAIASTASVNSRSMRSRVARPRASSAPRSARLHSDGICASQLGACAARISFTVVAVGAAGKPRQRFDQRQVGLADAVMIEALAMGDPDTAAADSGFEERFGQRALADAGLAGHEDRSDAGPPAPRAKRAAKLRHLGGAPDEPRRLGHGPRCCRIAHDSALRSPAPSAGSRAGAGSRCKRGRRASSPSAPRSSWMQEVSASSLTARPPQTWSNSSCLVTSVLRALGEHGEHRRRPRRQLRLDAVAPELAGARVEPERTETRTADPRPSQDVPNFPEVSRNSPSTLHPLPSMFACSRPPLQSRQGTAPLRVG